MAVVPPGVMTLICTTPQPAGLNAVMRVLLITVTPLAGVFPKRTLLVWAKPLPVMVTVVFPAAGPAVGDRPVMVGWAR